MEPTIRLVTPEDAPGVVATVKEVYEEYGFTWEAGGYHADLYDLSEYVDPDRARFWVAELEDEIVGCGGLCYIRDGLESLSPPGLAIWNSQTRLAGAGAEIVRMYVRPKARRRGIAQRIMDLILQECRLRGIHLLEIWSDKRFHEAHILYEKYGAAVIGDRICDDPDEAPEWGFTLFVR